jgi:hypothetical protein
MASFGYERLYGTEEVEAVFVCTEKPVETINSYSEIMFYLKFLDNNTDYFIAKDVSYNNEILKSSIRIDTRDIEIKDKNIIINKLMVRIKTRDKELKTISKTISELKETKSAFNYLSKLLVKIKRLLG